MNNRPSPAYLEMIKSKLDALNKLDGRSPNAKGRDEFGMHDHYAQFRNDDHLDIMGRAALDYMQRQRDQNGGHPPL